MNKRMIAVVIGLMLALVVGPLSAHARYLNPNTGRFQTMDSYEGTQTDPPSLHKYLYANNNPINKNDPSGQMALAIGMTLDFGISSSFSLSIRAKWEQARMPVYKGAIALAGIAVGLGVASLALEEIQIMDAERALEDAGTSVRDLLDKARNILRSRRGNATPPKIIPMPLSVIPEVARNVAVGQLSNPVMLKRAGVWQTLKNRYYTLKGKGVAGFGKSWDEYPFASSVQGGKVGAVVSAVDENQNWIQGGIIAACYLIEKISVGDSYEVVVTP